MTQKKIIHIDMDAFYASVEQRDNPDLKGRPVIVGGSPASRSVVCACSYEARKYGVHSAMACSKAYRLCPQAAFVKPRFDAYKKVSRQIHEIFYSFTDIIEPLSLDEAYLDVTENKIQCSYATTIAKQIRKEIYEKTNLTASAGVSFNKFLAKVASDYNKPDGLTVITPETAPEFIDSLPIGKFHGIGKVTEKKMNEMGINTGSDIKKYNRTQLMELFGKVGEYYYKIANCQDDRPVSPQRTRKSMGKEITLSEDITDKELIIDFLREIILQLTELMEKYDIKGRTITLKVKYYDFQLTTRSLSLNEPVNSSEIIFANIIKLLNNTEAGFKKVRLLGVSLSNLDNEDEEECSCENQLIFDF